MKKIWSDSYLAEWIENTVAGENPLQDPVELVSQCCGDEVEEVDKRCVCITCEKNCGVKEKGNGKKDNHIEAIRKVGLGRKGCLG